MAATYKPQQLIEFLPELYCAKIRECSLDVATHPEDVLLVRSICVDENFDWKTSERSERTQHYQAGIAWHKYFHPEVPLKDFEARKFIGIVERIETVNGKIMAIGKFETYFIRENFVELVAPNRSKFQTYVDSIEMLKPFSENNVALHFPKKTMDTIIFVGTEIWVIREE